MFFEEFVYRIEQQIKNGEFSYFLHDNSMFTPSFNTVLYLVVSPFLGDEHILDELSELASTILSIQLESFSEKRSDIELKLSIREFLIQESTSKEVLTNEKIFKLQKRLSRKTRKDEAFVNGFYNSFCKAQIRLIDIDDDFDFLIEVLRQVSLGSENRKEILFPFIKDVLDSVIINKTVPHSRAREEMQKGFKSANYMTEFQDSLKKIITKWNLV